MFLEAVKTPPQNIVRYEREMWMMGRVNEELQVVDNSTSCSKHTNTTEKKNVAGSLDSAGILTVNQDGINETLWRFCRQKYSDFLQILQHL